MATDMHESGPEVDMNTFDQEMDAARDALELFRRSGSEADARELEQIADYLRNSLDKITDEDRSKVENWLYDARMAALDHNRRDIHGRINPFIDPEEIVQKEDFEGNIV